MSTPKNSGSNTTTRGVIVPLEVWNQMQSLLAMYQPNPTPKPSAPARLDPALNSLQDQNDEDDEDLPEKI
ncbi:hypothetical protein PtB15_16B148 [Puccinia triticina]|nr:hypothetical protein PtB15_16B148 [Puccinia triticina]